MLISVKVKPKSFRESVEINAAGIYEVRVHTAPEDGKANKRIIELLAEHFKTAKQNIKIRRGPASRNKLIEIKQFVLPEIVNVNRYPRPYRQGPLT